MAFSKGGSSYCISSLPSLQSSVKLGELGKHTDSPVALKGKLVLLANVWCILDLYIYEELEAVSLGVNLKAVLFLLSRNLIRKIRTLTIVVSYCCSSLCSPSLMHPIVISTDDKQFIWMTTPILNSELAIRSLSLMSQETSSQPHLWLGSPTVAILWIWFLLHIFPLNLSSSTIIFDSIHPSVGPHRNLRNFQTHTRVSKNRHGPRKEVIVFGEF